MKYYFLKRYGQNNIYDKLEHFMEQIFKIPYLEIVHTPSDRQSQIMALNFMKRYTLNPRDAYHLVTVVYNNIQYIATFDQDFEHVAEVKIFSS